MSAAVRLVPRTLFGRNLLLIVALIVLGQLAFGLVWYTQVQRPRLDRAAAALVRHADLVRAGLTQLGAGQHERYIEELNRAELERGGEMRIAPAPPAQARPLRRAMSGRFLVRLQARLGGDSELRWEPAPARRLWVHMPGRGLDLWFGYASEGLLPDVSGLVIGWSLVAPLLALAGAVLIQRRINAPLRALADAAGDVAAGKPPRPVPEDAPQEIALVAQSFRRMADGLDRMERERALMLAGVSHDLRTPLTKLRLGLEMLDNPREAELIASMVRSIETADGIIDQFVDYARIGQDEAVQPGDLDALVRHAVQALADPRIEIALQLEVLPLVLLRPVATERLLGNLLQNAMRHGAPPIIVRTERAGARARLVVWDCGPGIPEAELERLRQPFVRLDAARSGKPGAGLGLAIADRVARLHGSELVLRNRAQGGLEASVAFAFASPRAGRGRPRA